MKFFTVTAATALLATSVLAVPAANPEAAAEPWGYTGKGAKYNNWCKGPGQMCYKNKRFVEIAGTVEEHEKREAAAEPWGYTGKGAKYNNWCKGPGQMCYKNKRFVEVPGPVEEADTTTEPTSQ